MHFYFNATVGKRLSSSGVLAMKLAQGALPGPPGAEALVALAADVLKAGSVSRPQMDILYSFYFGDVFGVADLTEAALAQVIPGIFQKQLPIRVLQGDQMVALLVRAFVAMPAAQDAPKEDTGCRKLARLLALACLLDEPYNVEACKNLPLLEERLLRAKKTWGEVYKLVGVESIEYYARVVY